MAKSINLQTWLESVAYLKGDIDTLLAGKSDTDHTHDSRYYTESEIDSQLNTISGTITSNYNTLDGKIDDEVDALETAISGKADSTHDHDSDYAPLTHNHTKSQITDFAHTHTGADVTVDTNKTLSTKLGEIDTAITNLETANWDIEIVTSLPNEGSAGKLYFLHDSEESTSGANSFDEYIWDATSERFEKLGQRKINLTNYVTDVDIELSNAGVLTISLTKDANAQSL